jgi:hypothetical protein
MKALMILSVLFSLNSYATSSHSKVVSEWQLSLQDLDNEVFYNVEDIPVKTVKYIRSFDNDIIVPSQSYKNENLTIRELPFYNNVDTVILKKFTDEQSNNAIKIFRIDMGGEGGT